jgi:site-specific recombinase XerD
MTKLNLPSDTPLDSIEIKDISLDMLKSFTKLDALNYLNYVASERNNSPKTRARKLSSLKMFYKCLNNNLNLLTENPVKDIDFPKLPQMLPKYLTLNDSIKLLTNFDTESPYFTRDYCIVTLFINCGMRLSELVGLNIQDIDFYEQSMRLLGKGNKERIIHLNNACVEALKAYLEDRQQLNTPEKALFLSKQNRRISGRRVEQIVINSLKECNLDNRGITTHKLRHTAATLMYQYGNVDTLILKEILGHKSIATTEIYTHISNDSIKDAMDASPLADINKKAHKQ